MADVNDLLNRATTSITEYFAAKDIVDGHDSAVADLQAQIDALNAELPAKQDDAAKALESVKRVYAEIIGNM